MSDFKPPSGEPQPVANAVGHPPHQEDAHLQSLPPIDINEVIGVCEIVQEHGGRVDLHELVRELGYLRLMQLAVEGARTLGMVKVRDGEVMFTPLGRTWIGADPQERQRLLQHQMASLKLFRWICTLMRDAHAPTISEDNLLSQLCTLLSAEDAPSTFWTLVNWGTHAQIFRYEPKQKTLVLRSPGSGSP